MISPIEEKSGDIIVEGLGFLDDVEFALPLPRTISGKVVKRKYNEKKEHETPFAGVLVEIGGIVSPSEDKTEADKKPSCITDSNGKFIVVLPDKYSLKETITVTISQGSNKQEFIKNASEVINAVPEQKDLEQFILLDSIGDEIDFIDAEIQTLKSNCEATTENTSKK